MKCTLCLLFLYCICSRASVWFDSIFFLVANAGCNSPGRWWINRRRLVSDDILKQFYYMQPCRNYNQQLGQLKPHSSVRIWCVCNIK